MENLTGKTRGKRLVRCDMHSHSWHTRGIMVSGERKGTWYEKAFDSLSRAVKGREFKMPSEYEFYFRPGVSPLEIHCTSMARGMDFSCLSDWECIDGWVELLDKHPELDEKLIKAVELSTRVPGKPYDVHIGVYGLSEGDFKELRKISGNVADVKKYCDEKGILASLNHPLPPWYLKDIKYDARTLDYLLNLFPVIEARNGLTRKEDNFAVEDYCKRHGKAMTAGSDSSIGNVGRTWIGVKARKEITKQEFLEELKKGRGIPGGVHGGANAIAESFREHANLSNDIYWRDSNHPEGMKLDVNKKTIFRVLDYLIRTGVKLSSRVIAEAGYNELDRNKLRMPE